MNATYERDVQTQKFAFLRTLNNGLGPQAVATGGMRITKAVFEVGICHFATTTLDAGREGAFDNFTTEVLIQQPVPYFEGRLLANVGKGIFHTLLSPTQHKTVVGMHECHTGTHIAIPSNGHGTPVNEGTIAFVVFSHRGLRAQGHGFETNFTQVVNITIV